MKIFATEKFNKHLEKIAKKDKLTAKKIHEKIIKLQNNPHLGKPLTYDLTGKRSLRIDPYRIIYEIKENENKIILLEIGHRKKVYSNR